MQTTRVPTRGCRRRREHPDQRLWSRHVIEARGLTKRYGDKLAVDDLTFGVSPGMVTGFLGPNGAGKSTTMRMMVGLDRPSGGSVLVNGRAPHSHAAPLHEVGALLEARAVHPGRSARNHLRALALTSGIGRSRVDQVLELVGLTEVADKRVGAFSLGMGQRLGVAAALLGDPATLVLDEPINGLDLDGIRWIRSLLTELAAEGRTVFLSSHLMSEMALTADHVIVVGKGRLLRDQPMAGFISDASTETVRVRATRIGRLARLVEDAGATVTVDGEALVVEGLSSDEIGTVAARARITVLELSPQSASLEDAYLALTRDSIDHRTGVRVGGRVDDGGLSSDEGAA
jgi:ABC-2 type transport system ATP-binding protein